MKTAIIFAFLGLSLVVLSSNATRRGDFSIQIETTAFPEYSTTGSYAYISNSTDQQVNITQTRGAVHQNKKWVNRTEEGSNSTFAAKPLQMATTAIPTKRTKPAVATLQTQSKNATTQTQTQSQTTGGQSRMVANKKSAGRTTTTKKPKQSQSQSRTQNQTSGQNRKASNKKATGPSTTPRPSQSQSQSQSPAHNRTRRQAPSMDSMNSTSSSYGHFCDGIIEVSSALGIKLENNESGFAASLGSLCRSVDNLQNAIMQVQMKIMRAHYYPQGGRGRMNPGTSNMNIHLNSTGSM